MHNTYGVFFSVSSAIIPNLSHPEKTSIFIALMFSCLTLAMIMGVPLGIWTIQAIGWHGVFLLISGLSFLCLGFIFYLFPKNCDEVHLNIISSNISFKTLSFYFITIFGFGGGFIFYPYIEPWLIIIGNMDLKQISLALSLIGIGCLAGNLLGGLLPIKLGLNIAVITVLILQILSLISLTIYSTIISPLPFLVFWAITIFVLAPTMQAAVISDKYFMNNRRLSASFNATAFNLGLGLAGYLGGIIISYGNLKNPPLIAALVVFIAIPIVLARVFVNHLIK